jgi:tRNA 2-thiouridine synthesizing protein A
MSISINIDEELDVKGMVCPRPMVMTMTAMKGMETGQVLRVTANDSSVKHSIPAFCERAGYSLLEQSEELGTFIFVIQK